MLRRSIAVGAVLLSIGWAHPVRIHGQAVSPSESRDLSSPSIRLSHVLELAQAQSDLSSSPQVPLCQPEAKGWESHPLE